jgi:hypothetical protein
VALYTGRSDASCFGPRVARRERLFRIKLGEEKADKKVDGGFNVHGYGSFSWRKSP